MCGIAGYSDKKGIKSVPVLKAMTDAIAHRGPDGEGLWHNAEETIYLGHRRLSIIDLSDCGHQPMHYMDRYSLVFNGEIYNYLELKEDLLKRGYSFFSHTDTEVLMAMYHAYKDECLAYFDGMFSFALFDKAEQTLFCARDRFGEKPFYYHYEEGAQFYFASEMKALWAAGISRGINNRMVYNYIAHEFLQNPSNRAETFYSDINKLEAASFLVLSVPQCKIISRNKYWQLKTDTNAAITPEEASEGFKQLFTTSVKRRLRSDVPVGSSLSGGLDSSLIVLMIDQLKKGSDQKQKTFSARFPGFVKDEGKYMQLVIDRCNVSPYFTYPTEDTLLHDIENVFYHQEEPFSTASVCAQYEVMKLAKEGDVTVMLDGQGADEILAGYHPYYKAYFNELKRNDETLYKNERQAYQAFYDGSRINPIEKRDVKQLTKQYLAPLFSLSKKALRLYRQQTDPEFNNDFYRACQSNPFAAAQEFASLNESLLWSTTWGLEQLLRYADRNSMAHSLEVRLPFLSHELVEFLFALPGHYKIKNGWTKWVMRHTFEHLLPQEIAWRKDKIGYEPPQSKWLERSELKEMIHEKRRRLVQHGILNKNVLNEKVANRSLHIKRNDWAHLMAGSLLAS